MNAGPAWQMQAPGVWATPIGEIESLDPLSLIGAEPRLDALRALGDACLPQAVESMTAATTPRQTVITLPLTDEEHIYGLGLQFMCVNQRGRTRVLRVNSDPKQDTGETHAPVPFYISSSGYGLLVNTARIVTIHCGSTVRRAPDLPPSVLDRNADPDWLPTPRSNLLEIVVPAAGTEIMVFAGPPILDVVRRYNLFFGGGALPPRWGLGFWHRVPMLYTSEQAMAEAMEFRQRDYPCDVIGLEPGWHSHSYPVTYEWSAERFSDPKTFVSQMRAKGFHVNLWEHAWVHPEASIYEQMEPLSGSHSVWGGLAPDYTLPAARDAFMALHRQKHLAVGVSGYKVDECDGSELTPHSWMFPAHATFPSGHDGEQMRQVYGLVLQRMIADLFQERNLRTYGLVRASLMGASSLPAVLYSDLYDHRQFVLALCNASFSGLLWTPEVRGAESAEEWVRRIQVLCFSHLAMLNAWSSGTKPWTHTEVEPIVRKYLRLRMRLMPYLYSAFARYHFEGTPPCRAMALELDPARLPERGSESPDPLDLGDQFMFGDSLLVAPLFAGEVERDVYLPFGVWYQFETGERYDGGRTVRVCPGLECLPVFAREGAIIPMMPALDHAPSAGETVDLEVHHFGAVPGSFELYDDDGETMAYDSGAYRWRTLEVTIGAGGEREGRMSPTEDGWPSSYNDISWCFR